eukprot:COSAG02_NODE_1894_length_10475_cov_10.204125_4_plen_284_part_00
MWSSVAGVARRLRCGRARTAAKPVDYTALTTGQVSLNHGCDGAWQSQQRSLTARHATGTVLENGGLRAGPVGGAPAREARDRRAARPRARGAARRARYRRRSIPRTDRYVANRRSAGAALHARELPPIRGRGRRYCVRYARVPEFPTGVCASRSRAAAQGLRLIFNTIRRLHAVRPGGKSTRKQAGSRIRYGHQLLSGYTQRSPPYRIGIRMISCATPKMSAKRASCDFQMDHAFTMRKAPVSAPVSPFDRITVRRNVHGRTVCRMCKSTQFTIGIPTPTVIP